MMHDWTIKLLKVIWKESTVIITFEDSNSHEVDLIIKGLTDLKIPKKDDWGESDSVNEIEGPILLDNGKNYLAIEIQSGDKIEIEADSISMPI